MTTPNQARCLLTCAALLSLTGPAAAEKAKRVVKISAKEAKARGLWPVGVRIDITDGGLTPTTFPSNKLYLTLSGPPGGPLGLEIRRGSLKKDATPLPGTFHPEGDAKIKIGRHKLQASAYTVGKSLARSHGCVVTLRTPRGTHGRLLLRFWAAAGESRHPGCASLSKQPPFRTLLPSIRLTRK